MTKMIMTLSYGNSNRNTPRCVGKNCDGTQELLSSPLFGFCSIVVNQQLLSAQNVALIRPESGRLSCVRDKLGHSL